MKKLVFALLLLVGCSQSTSPSPNDELWLQWSSNPKFSIIHRHSCKQPQDIKSEYNDCAKIKAQFESMNGSAGACPICKPCQ